MGIDPASLILEATAALGAGTAATGTAAAATAATAGTVATGAAAAGTAAAATGAVAAGIGEAAGAATAIGAGTGAAAAAGLSSSTLLTLGSSALTGAVGAMFMPKGPKPGSPPKAPSLFGPTQGATAMMGPGTGDVNGTFLTGNNRSPQIAGGKKTLLGQ